MKLDQYSKFRKLNEEYGTIFWYLNDILFIKSYFLKLFYKLSKMENFHIPQIPKIL